MKRIDLYISALALALCTSCNDNSANYSDNSEENCDSVEITSDNGDASYSDSYSGYGDSYSPMPTYDQVAMDQSDQYEDNSSESTIHEICACCHGTGECQVCKNDGGQVPLYTTVGADGCLENVWGPCRSCGGTMSCHACGGDGYLDACDM